MGVQAFITLLSASKMHVIYSQILKLITPVENLLLFAHVELFCNFVFLVSVMQHE